MKVLQGLGPVFVVLAAFTIGHGLTLALLGDRFGSRDLRTSLGDSAVSVVAPGGNLDRPPSLFSDLLVIFLGSSTCSFSRAEDMKPMVQAARLAGIRESNAGGQSVGILGIAVEPSPVRGIDYLRKIEGFDEMLAGGGWAHTDIGSMLESHLGTRVSTPQILIAERVSRAGVGGSSYVSRLRLRYRVSGASAIKSWAQNGARIPAGPGGREGT